MRGLVQALRPAGLPVSRRTGVRPAPPTGYGCWQAGYDERRGPDHRGGAESRRWCPTGHYQPCSLICSQPSSMAFSIASASSAERLPAVWVRIAWRSSSLIRLSLCTKSAATSSLAGGSDLRSSTMFSSGLTTSRYTGMTAMASNSRSSTYERKPHSDDPSAVTVHEAPPTVAGISPAGGCWGRRVRWAGLGRTVHQSGRGVCEGGDWRRGACNQEGSSKILQ